MKPRLRSGLLILGWIVGVFPIATAAAQAPKFEAPPKFQPTAAQLDAIAERTASLAKLLEQIKQRPTIDPGHPDDPYADVAVYHKAATWIVRHGEFYKPNYVDMTLKALETGERRARAVLDGKRPWTQGKGSRVRGYVSRVDGSIQPLAIVVPDAPPGIDGRYRLDVILHGRGSTLNEVSFINQHDDKPAKADEPGLVLHVFGRVNNAYRWAGETDVFEAIEAARRAFPVDERRIVLRGFSMGGAGAWHLGLQHPALWCAVESGAGFTETRKYTRKNDFPDYQEKGLRVYDAVDYALNAFNLPMAGYGGEIDPQLQASRNIREALEGLGFGMKTEGLVSRGEGLNFLHVIGAKTAHAVDPVSAVILRDFRDEHAARGLAPLPRPVRFITYTLKFNHAPGFSAERLVEHYKPARIEAHSDPSGDTVHVKVENINVLGIDRRMGELAEIAGQTLPLRPAAEGLLPMVYYQKGDDGWVVLDHDQSRALQENQSRRKAPGLQGPIDDAFTGPFLCVRGTGKPWGPATQVWADRRLEQFRAVWSQYMRGDLPIKDDKDVTQSDIERFHLVLFGDPGSNRVLEAIAPELPVAWSKTGVALGSKTYEAREHAPAFITVNPRASRRYVVINSGHTFGASEFAGTNALLYPHLGDYAIFRLGKPDGELVTSGFFNEAWKLP